MATSHIPTSFQSILWSTNINKLNVEKDKEYIIHQFLTYATLDQLRWLFATYTKEEIIDTFIHRPIKMYPKETFHFVKNYLLTLNNSNVDKDDYVTSIHGPVRLRAAGRVS